MFIILIILTLVWKFMKWYTKTQEKLTVMNLTVSNFPFKITIWTIYPQMSFVLKYFYSPNIAKNYSGIENFGSSLPERSFHPKMINNSI